MLKDVPLSLFLPEAAATAAGPVLNALPADDDDSVRTGLVGTPITALDTFAEVLFEAKPRLLSGFGYSDIIIEVRAQENTVHVDYPGPSSGAFETAVRDLA